mgnify:CR=1 FL=1|tara:strand:+ start:6448 stop:7176 length:729 start_codon:yes stop_codon:yes gene_type:complete
MILDERGIKRLSYDWGESDNMVVNKFGYNADIDGTHEDIWTTGGTLTRLSSAETMSVVSTSTADDTGGTGSITIQIEGIDNDWDVLKESVTLNGTGAVTTTGSFLRINRMFITSSGSGQTNAGKITATASSAATVQSTIEIGSGQTEQTQYAVPRGFRVIFTELQVNTNDNAGLEGLFIMNENNKGWRVKRRVFFTAGDVRISLYGEYADEKTDVKVTAKSLTGSNKLVAADYTFYLMRKHS